MEAIAVAFIAALPALIVSMIAVVREQRTLRKENTEQHFENGKRLEKMEQRLIKHILWEEDDKWNQQLELTKRLTKAVEALEVRDEC